MTELYLGHKKIVPKNKYCKKRYTEQFICCLSNERMLQHPIFGFKPSNL